MSKWYFLIQLLQEVSEQVILSLSSVRFVHPPIILFNLSIHVLDTDKTQDKDMKYKRQTSTELQSVFFFIILILNLH